MPDSADEVAKLAASQTVAGGLFLVLSNLFMSPAIYLSLLQNANASALVYFSLLIASSAYHACRAGFGCVVGFDDHVKLDYLYVYFSVLWTITHVGRSHVIRHDTRLLIFVLFFLPTAFLIVGGHMNAGVPIVAGVLPGLAMGWVALRNRVKVFRRLPWALLGIAIGGVACIFMYLLPSVDYEWAHGIWHTLVMLAVACIIYANFRYRNYANPIDDPEKFAPAPSGYKYNFDGSVRKVNAKA